MKKITLLILVLVLVTTVSVFGQSKIKYAYDAAGNRVSREIVLATRSLAADEEPTDVFTEEVAKRDLKYYSSIEGQVTVEISTLEGMKNGQIRIYRMDNGANVVTKKITSTREDLDISNQRSGIYILHITIDGEVTAWKLMKK